MTWPYILILCLLCIGGCLHDSGGNDTLPDAADSSSRRHSASLIIYIALYAAFILLAGLRFRVGMDTSTLEKAFNVAPPAVSDCFNYAKMPSGYGRHLILYSLFKQMGMGAWAPQLLCAMMLNIPVAVMIMRLCNRWFVASAIYILFFSIPLNFEVMLFGAAAGMLIWALPDMLPALRNGDNPPLPAGTLRSGTLYPWRFAVKLLIAAAFHASVIFMIWLPLLRLEKFRRWVTFNPRWIITSACGFAIIFLIRYILLEYNGIIGEPGWSKWLNITSERIAGYGDLINPAMMNIKGYAKAIILRIILPIAGAALLYRHSGSVSDARRDRYSLLATFLMIVAMLELWGLNMPAFRRLAWFLCPVAAPAFTLTLAGLSLQGRRCWWLTFLCAAVMHLYSYRTPAKYLPDGHTAELYLPYSSQIEKSYNLRREWIFFVYGQKNSHHTEPDTTLFLEEAFPPPGARLTNSIIYDNWKY